MKVRRNLLLIIIAAVLGLSVIFAWVMAGKDKTRTQTAVKHEATVSASALLNQVRELEAKGDLLGAKAVYQQLTNDFPGSSEMVNWQKKLEEINIRLLFSSEITANSKLYQIKPGDSLAKIAKEFKTTVELIQRSNNLTGTTIFPGRNIKVWSAPFSVFVDKSQNILILKTGEDVIRTYTVSTGTNNSTPTGTFKITNKLSSPTWFKSGAVVPPGSPENILGSRWLGFDLAGYGIHGTVEPQNLGKQVTAGCVRMANAEVEELYSIVPVGTEVTIVD